MIPAGTVNALTAWATGDDTRIAQLVTERDALIAGFLSGGKASLTVNSGGLNGKTFGALVSLSADEKLAVLTRALEELGEITLEPSVKFASFSGLSR